MIYPDAAPTRPQPVVLAVRKKHALLAAALFIVFAAAAGVALYIVVQARDTTATLTTENRHLTKQVATLRGQESTLQIRENMDYSTLRSDLVPLAQLATSTCSQDLTGPNGPAIFYFWCSTTKPSSSG